MSIHCLEVWGDLACFSRPESKVERYTYPCITPSAARGIYDAIYAKPQSFRWQIDRIELLNRPSYVALRRNEVKEKASVSAVRRWMSGTVQPEPLWADGVGADVRGRTQRQTIALRNPRYRISGHIVPWNGNAQPITAFDAQFSRRAEKGKCYYQPYLGCREFPAYFEIADSDSPNATDIDLDVGYMVYDVFDLSRPGDSSAKPLISLFRAQITGGILDVPSWDDVEVLKTPGGA